MKIAISYSEMLDRVSDWDDLCQELGLNPWCLSEGLIDGDDTCFLSEDIAKKYGII